MMQGEFRTRPRPRRFRYGVYLEPIPCSACTAIMNAGPPISKMMPGTTSNSIGRLMITGSRPAWASIREARCKRSFRAMFWIDWPIGVP